jgi:hypothetical protein
MTKFYKIPQSLWNSCMTFHDHGVTGLVTSPTIKKLNSNNLLQASPLDLVF